MTTTVRQRSGGAIALKSIVAPVLYLLLAAGLFSSAWSNPSYLSVGEPGDAEIYMWMLGWAPFAAGHGLNPLFSDFVIYPQGASLFWSLIPVFPGYVLSPVMAAVGPVVTYNLTMTLGVAGSAWCAYLAIKAFVKGAVGAWVGGLLYGFSPYMLAHSLGHPNLVLCFEPPLVMVLLAELLVWQRRKAWLVGLALGALCGVQLLTTPEILFTTGIVGLAGILLLAIMRPREIRSRLQRAWSGLAAAALLFIVLSALPLGFAFFGPQQVHGVVRQQDTFVTDALNFFVPTDVMLLTPSWVRDLSNQWTGDIAESNAYVGLPLIGLLGFVILRHRRQLLVQWSALLAGITAILSMGPHLHLAGKIHFHVPLPWLAVQQLPLFENVLPSRLMLFFYLLAGLAVALFVQEARSRLTGWRQAAALSWVVLTFLVLLPKVPWPVTANPVPAFFSGSQVSRVPDGSVALVLPFSTAPGFQPGPGADQATLPMLWQQASGMRFRMPEGGMNVPDVDGRPSGGRPPQSVTQSTMIAIQEGATAPPVTAELHDAIFNNLRTWKVQTVIVGPMYNQQAMVEFLTTMLGRAPERQGDVYVWWDVQA